MDIAALKAAALVATPGPWHDSGGTVDNFGNEYQGSLSFEWAANGRDEGDGMNARYREDAAYIALANPTSILSLIARYQQMEEALRELQEYAIREVPGGGAHHHPVWAKVADALAPEPAQS